MFLHDCSRAKKQCPARKTAVCGSTLLINKYNKKYLKDTTFTPQMTKDGDWGHSSVTECLPSMREAQVSILSMGKRKSDKIGRPIHELPSVWRFHAAEVLLPCDLPDRFQTKNKICWKLCLGAFQASKSAYL